MVVASGTQPGGQEGGGAGGKAGLVMIQEMAKAIGEIVKGGERCSRMRWWWRRWCAGSFSVGKVFDEEGNFYEAGLAKEVHAIAEKFEKRIYDEESTTAKKTK